MDKKGNKLIKGNEKVDFTIFENGKSWIYENMHQMYKYILLSVFIFICTPFIDKLIVTLFVNNIFVGVKSSVSLDILMIVYLLVCVRIFYDSFNRKYIASVDYVFFHSFLVLWYVYFRNCGTLNFHFIKIYSTPLSSFISYWDILFAFPAFALYPLFYLQKKSELKPANEILIDEMDLYPEDYLNAVDIDDKHSFADIKSSAESNYAYAKELCSKLYSVNSSNAFAVAILGRWGAGKSYFLTQIKKVLTSENEYEVKVIEFYPWKNKGEEAIIKDFFALLSKELAPLNGNIAPQVGAYIDALLEPNKKWETRLLRLIFLGGLIPKNTEEEYSKLKKIIAQIDKRIIIIIIDLDRLDGGEILGVLKLIRNVANFENLVFLAAYDRTYVNNAIGKILNDHNCNSYLEKIFQLEISLPVFDPKSLSAILINLLEHSIPNLFKGDKKKDVKEYIIENEQGIIWDYLKNVRDIIRFVNLFILDFKYVQGFFKDRTILEISLNDFFWSRLLKLKFPSSYLLLYEKRHTIFDSDGTNYSLKKEEEGLFTFELQKNNGNSLDDLVVEIVKLLFRVPPKTKAYIKEHNQYKKSTPRCISNIESFYKYFSNKAFIGKIELTQILHLFEEDKEKIKVQLVDWFQKIGNSKRLINLFSGVDLIKNYPQKEDYEKILEALFSVEKYINDDYDPMKDDNLLIMLITSNEYIDHYYVNKQEHQTFIEKLFLSNYLTESFLKTLIGLMTVRSEKIFFKKVYGKRISQLLADEVNPSKFFTRLDHIIRGRFLNTDDDEVKDSIKDLIKSNLDYFIKSLIVQNPKEYFQIGINEKVIGFLFENLENFENFYKMNIVENDRTLLSEVFFEVVVNNWKDKFDSHDYVFVLPAALFIENDYKQLGYPSYIHFSDSDIKEGFEKFIFEDENYIIHGLPNIEGGVRILYLNENVSKRYCYLVVPFSDPANIIIELRKRTKGFDAGELVSTPPPINSRVGYDLSDYDNVNTYSKPLIPYVIYKIELNEINLLLKFIDNS